MPNDQKVKAQTALEINDSHPIAQKIKDLYANDKEAVEAFLALSKEEGILPALESSHAIAHAMKLAPKMDKNQSIVVTLSGRGDKDVETIAKYIGAKI